jgi:hypothetical protein
MKAADVARFINLDASSERSSNYSGTTVPTRIQGIVERAPRSGLFVEALKTYCGAIEMLDSTVDAIQDMKGAPANKPQSVARRGLYTPRRVGHRGRLPRDGEFERFTMQYGSIDDVTGAVTGYNDGPVVRRCIRPGYYRRNSANRLESEPRD